MILLHASSISVEVVKTCADNSAHVLVMLGGKIMEQCHYKRTNKFGLSKITNAMKRNSKQILNKT